MSSTLTLFAGLSWEGSLVSVLLIVMACAALGMCRKNRLRLAKEEEAELTRLKEALKSAPGSIEAAEKLLPASSSSLVVQSLRDALYEGQINRERPGFDQWNHWPRYLAGVFVFVGLCGTVWGIATSVSSLGQAVTSISHATGPAADAGSSAFTLESWNRLLEGIELLLAGMKSAFVCTLLGLLATLVVSWYNARYVAACREVEEQTGLLADRFFIPLYREVNSLRNRAVMQEQIKRAIDALAENAEQLTLALDPATENLNRISAVANSITRNLQIAADTLKQQNVIAEERAVQIQRILTDLSQRLLLSYQHLENSANALTAAAGSFPEERAALTTLTNEVKTASRQMEATVRRLAEDLSGAQEEQGEALRSVSESIAATHRTLQGAVREFERTLNDVIVTAESPALRQELEYLRTELLKELRSVDSRLKVLPPSASPADERKPERKPGRPASEGDSPGTAQSRSAVYSGAPRKVGTAESRIESEEPASSEASPESRFSVAVSSAEEEKKKDSAPSETAERSALSIGTEKTEAAEEEAGAAKGRTFMDRISGVFKKGQE